MAAKNPSELDAVDLALAYTDDDGTFQADLLSEGTDDDTDTGINVAGVSKIGKGGVVHGHCLRIIYADGKGNLANGDTLSVWCTSIHNTPNMNIVAYTDSNSVSATAEIQISWAEGENVFTLTTAFIAVLGDLGSGSFGIRMVATDNPGGGDIQISEVDADFSTGNGEPDNRRRQVLHRRRH